MPTITPLPTPDQSHPSDGHPIPVWLVEDVIVPALAGVFLVLFALGLIP